MENRTIPPGHASARKTEMGDTFNRVLFSALDALQENSIPYALIGGIAASGMGRPRSTHDIDVFVRPEDADAALEALKGCGFETERTDLRWLFKGWMDEMMVDIIFKSSGDIYFDTEMQEHARPILYHGRQIPAVAPEDLVIIKAAVHSEIGPHHWHDALAILSHATIDWQYLLKRARRAPRRLLALLIYAQSNDIWIPNHTITELSKVIFSEPSLNGPHALEPKVQPRITPIATTVATASETMGVVPSPIPETYLIGRIQNALATDERTAALDLQLNVGCKHVLVKGEVNSHEQLRAIEAVIREIASGFEINNQIRVTDMAEPVAEEVV
jgi:predicted nucleotidyltransferase